MTQEYIFWIGIQESEIEQTRSLFSGSITMFGSNKNGNYSYDKEFDIRFNYNVDNDSWIDFVNETAHKIVNIYPECKFMLYYPMDAIFYDKIITNRMIGVNNPILLDLWDNKFRCREWIGNNIPTIPTEICYAEKIISNFSNIDGTKKVIQGEYSCGGNDTWLLTTENKNEIFSRMYTDRRYAISQYMEHSVSINIHLVIYPNEVILFPASIQIINLREFRFEYCGADFIAYSHLSKKIHDKVREYSLIIGERLRRSNYLGICGIDYIATENEVYFSEINPRFQSSTILLNMALNDSGSHISMQYMHLDAFKNNKCQFAIESLVVNYSYYKNTYSKKNEQELRNLSKLANTYSDVIYIDDDLLWSSVLEEHTYLYKLIFRKNITSISHDFNLIIHPNLRSYDCIADLSNIKNQMLELKIMLLSHGITISRKAKEYLNMTNGINFYEFSAIDLLLNDKYYINVPYQTNFSQLSPFSIDLDENGLNLCYCNQNIANAKVRGVDRLSEKTSSSGIPYSEIAYLGNDRLRIFHRLGCFYKQIRRGCKFCDIENDNRPLPLTDIKEVIDDYNHCSNIRHYLIGGGSQNPDDNFEFICQVAKYLKSKSKKPIYLMSLPTNNMDTLDHLKQSGITEVSFNIEIFDRTLAKKYMPGKGEIPLEVYLDALRMSVELWGNTGNVRTIFIVGLESKQSLIKGIEQVCKMGVSPILSLFKPIEDTPLSHLLPPSDTDILDIVKQTKHICKKYGVPLGPTCAYCEDNTLKLTL